MSKWKSLGAYCLSNATTLPTTHASTFMKVIFNTDYYLNKTGFSARVHSSCGGLLTAPSGEIVLGNNTAKENTRIRSPTLAWECQWNVTVRPGKTISVQISEINIPATPGSETCLNYVIVSTLFIALYMHIHNIYMTTA